MTKTAGVPTCSVLPLQPLLGHCSVKEDGTVYIKTCYVYTSQLNALWNHDCTKSTFIWLKPRAGSDDITVYISDNYFKLSIKGWHFSMTLIAATEVP